MKKITSIILTVFMLLSCVGFGAFADEPSTGSADRPQTRTYALVGKIRGNKYTSSVTYYDGSTFCYLSDSNALSSSYIYYFPLSNQNMVYGYQPSSNAEIFSSDNSLDSYISFDWGIGDTYGNDFVGEAGFPEIYSSFLGSPIEVEIYRDANL